MGSPKLKHKGKEIDFSKRNICDSDNVEHQMQVLQSLLVQDCTDQLFEKDAEKLKKKLIFITNNNGNRVYFDCLKKNSDKCTIQDAHRLLSPKTASLLQNAESKVMDFKLGYARQLNENQALSKRIEELSYKLYFVLRLSHLFLSKT